MIYRIQSIVFEADQETLQLPSYDSQGWRIVEVLDSHRARVSPDKWYLTVLVEGP